MAESYASAVIPAPVDRVWQRFGDFAGLAEWHPAVTALELEGGAPTEVGVVRRLWLSDGSPIRERLTAFDSISRGYGYEMLEGPFQVRTYRAAVRLAPVTATGATFAEWSACYDTDADQEAELDRVFVTEVFASGLAGLARFYTDE
ncbi:hypothetical protein FHR84_001433 [Actinopolyspora biskrensis]|uniref:Polyketide cyclase / dehydrase and lipid transport n=1 Tax=Actinopolyspora biskrensis TaxID=1470178 RepID=A0A852YTU0_9ACTN|nr:SRPBCC family protein [Actinopolyspora biskrensis]NYH78111.1 hypothetical protein [Actinopolyspora biskrensis]